MPKPARRSASHVFLWTMVAVVPVALGIALLATLLNPSHMPLKTGVILPSPRPLIDFKLQNANGQSLDKIDLREHWTLIFTGYTHCPDVCPTTLAALAQVTRKLGADASRLRVLFISVDPKRDTPQVLLRYVRAFSPDFIGATGSQAELQALGHNLGFAYSYDPSTDGHPDDYVVNHSAGMMLINPQAQLAAYFSPPIKVGLMAADLRQVIDGRSAGAGSR